VAAQTRKAGPGQSVRVHACNAVHVQHREGEKE
jgi:hypothetical protein